VGRFQEELVSALSRRGLRAAVLVLGLVIAAGCGAARARMASASIAAPPAAMAASAPPPLERSLFARDPNGQLSEDALQRILAAPIELELPARVGVVAVTTATDWRGPGPDQRVPTGMAALVWRLRRDAAFSLVTQTMVIPSGALGMEALREVAARYRLRYVLLYREVLVKKSRLNAYAWGYITGLGALFLPGQRQEVYGYIEASMLDVKTGTLMFTTRRSIDAAHKSNQWHKQDKHEQLAALATSRFAPDLAVDVLADLRRYAAAAVAENATKRGGAPGEPVVTLPDSPTVATDAP